MSSMYVVVITSFGRYNIILQDKRSISDVAKGLRMGGAVGRQQRKEGLPRITPLTYIQPESILAVEFPEDANDD